MNQMRNLQNLLVKYDRVAIDSAIFVYFLENVAEFGDLVNPLFTSISKGSTQGITSIISLLELLSSPKLTPSIVRELKESFKKLPNLKVFPVDEDIALQAAEIRRKYGFKTPDAIQLATAKIARAKAFITNDKKLLPFKALKIIIL